MTSPVLVALDTDDLDLLGRWSADLSGVVGGLKVGLQAYMAHGPRVVATVRDAHTQPCAVFLDVKLHDIPNTVAGAAAAVADLGVDMFTVHAAGGPQMVAAAVKAAPDTAVLAVTVLTSMGDEEQRAVGQADVADQVVRLAALAIDAGAAGVICASTDVARLRSRLGPDPLLVVPGIRPARTVQGPAAQSTTAKPAQDDQARVGQPGATMAAGANWLVVGRPITTAPDPVAAARDISEEARSGRP